MLEAQLLLICRGTDEEGQLYGFAVASGKRYVEQRKLFMQYLANTKNKFDEIIGDEASLICNKVYIVLKNIVNNRLVQKQLPQENHSGKFYQAWPGNISTATACSWNLAALSLPNSVQCIVA